jgi:hypothetical protein
MAPRDLRKSPRRARVFDFRQFICQFLNDELHAGPVLDVAGGRGDLAWLLTNVDNVEAIVVDPRVVDHTKLARTARWQHAHAERDLSSLEKEFGPQGPLRELCITPPYRNARHARVFLDEALIEALHGCHQRSDGHCAGVERPNPDPALPEDDASWAVPETWRLFWKAANARSEAMPSSGHHQPPRSECDAEASPCAERILDPAEAWRVFRKPGLIVAFHADEATEPCLDLALSLQCPFAIVPCCVFPSQFPERRHDGQPVKSYATFCDYLQAKHPRIRRFDMVSLL